MSDTAQADAASKTGSNGRPLPPIETRFKPGVSGNPGGMPKGTKPLKRRMRRALVRFLTEHPEQIDLGVQGLWEGCKAGDAACHRIAWDRLDGVLEKKIDVRARAIVKVIVRGN